MAKRRRFIAEIPPYLTIGRKVWLGKCSKRTRHNALEAGLIPTTAREMGKFIRSMQAIQRISAEGVWYDTVRY